MKTAQAAWLLGWAVVWAAMPTVRAGEEHERPTGPSSLGEVQARLASDEPAAAAWGAYLTGRDGHEEAVPALFELLRSRVQPFDRPWNLAHRAALDALVRLEVPVAEGLLARHERRFPVQVLLLRARRPGMHREALLHRFDRAVRAEHMGVYEVAIGNLLAADDATGLAARWLAGIRMTLEVHVYTPAPEIRVIGGGRSIGGGSGDAWARVPEGFPPYVHYSLWPAPGPGRVLLAHGPRPVYWRRTERAAAGLITGFRVHRYETTGCCLEWLARHLRVEVHELEITMEESVFVGWTDADAYVTRVVAARDALLDRYWALARRLLVRGDLLPEEARALEPVLALVLHDARTERDQPVPALPAATRPDFPSAEGPGGE